MARRPAPDRFRGSFGPSFASSFAVAADGLTVATGHPDTTVLLWELSAPAGGRPVAALPAAEREGCWADMAGADAGRALAAMTRLTEAPGLAVSLLSDRLGPVESPSADSLRRLIADLGNARFARREAATKQLGELAELADALLREALRGLPAHEVRQRIETLLVRPRLVQRPEARRSLRAVRLLESLGGVEARRVLRRLARGAGASRLTQEARAALRRLARRPAPP